MKRNGCDIALYMQKYTNMDEVFQAVKPYINGSQSTQEITNTGKSLVISIDDIRDFDDGKHKGTELFLYIAQCLYDALAKTRGMIRIKVEFCTYMGCHGMFDLDFPRWPVPAGEEVPDDWKNQEEAVNQQIELEKKQESYSRRIQPAEKTYLTIELQQTDDTVIEDVKELVQAAIPTMHMTSNKPTADYESAELHFCSPDLGLTAHEKGAKQWTNGHYLIPYVTLVDKLRQHRAFLGCKMSYKTAMGLQTIVKTKETSRHC